MKPREQETRRRRREVVKGGKETLKLKRGGRWLFLKTKAQKKKNNGNPGGPAAFSLLRLFSARASSLVALGATDKADRDPE